MKWNTREVKLQDLTCTELLSALHLWLHRCSSSWDSCTFRKSITALNDNQIALYNSAGAPFNRVFPQIYACPSCYACHVMSSHGLCHEDGKDDVVIIIHLQVGDNSLTNLLLMTMQVNLMKTIKLISGPGSGHFRNFLRKKSWSSPFSEWIDAWPFTNTYTKTSDPPPNSSEKKITGSENN